jgi:hypothetical protein
MFAEMMLSGVEREKVLTIIHHGIKNRPKL